MRQTGPERLDSSTDHLPDSETEDERQHFIFYQDDGGLRATDEANNPVDTIYYLGVIDICTPYTTFKRAEHIWKGLHADRVCPRHPFLARITPDLTLTSCSTKLAPWSPASTRNVSSPSSKRLCAMGKVANASKLIESRPRLWIYDTSLFWIAFIAKRTSALPAELAFKVSGFRIFWFMFWFMDTHNFRMFPQADSHFFSLPVL